MRTMRGLCRRALRGAVVLGALLAPALGQVSAPANNSIRKEELEADLRFLASDAMRGRLTGTHEYLLAAQFIESRFRRLGLKPLGVDAGFVQPFTLNWSELGDVNWLRVSKGGVESQAQLLEEFMPLMFSANARAKGGVVFAGFGIDAPALGWRDLDPGAVRGKVVLILEGEPAPDDPKSIFDGVVTSVHSDPLRKILNAQKAGALAVVMVNARDWDQATNRFSSQARSYWPDKQPHLQRFALTAQADRVTIPAASISAPFAQRLLGDLELAEQARQAERAGGMKPIAIAGDIEMEISLSRHVVEDRNVVAVHEGGDSKLKEEAVLVTAHYDHNGAEENQVYPGADDNGSGVVGLLEIAEAYTLAAAQGQRPKRSVVFVAFGSEERCCGPLLGAWAWIESPRWPLKKTVAVLNMDMISRSEEVPEGGGRRFRGLPVQTAASNANAVNLIGTSYSPDLRRAAEHANRALDLTLRFRYDNNPSNLLRRSDQWPFLQSGVPALWFHTGLHPDYHTSADGPDKADYAKTSRVARLVHQLSWDLAEQSGHPAILSPRPVPAPD